jgi:hypothetical protein
MTITISQDRLRTNITKNLQKRRRFAQDAEARRQVKEQRRLANQRKRREREAREKAAEEKEEAVYMAKLAARRAVADAEMSRMDEVRKRVFLRCHFILNRSSFCQDRLGTNIGKALKKDAFLQQRSVRTTSKASRVSQKPD